MDNRQCLNHDATQASTPDCWHQSRGADSVEWGDIEGRLQDQRDLAAALAKKVDKVPGKGLSTNDFTNADKLKLDSLTNTNAHEIVAPAAEPIFAFTAVTLSADGLHPADAATIGASDRVLGVSLTAGSTGDPVRVLTEGEVTNTGWAFTEGDLLYVGLNGVITPAQVGDFCQMVGWAVAPSKIFVRVGRAILRS